MRARGQRGFSLFELAIVVSVIALLATALLRTIVFYLEEAERVAAAQVVGVVNTALTARASKLVATGRAGDIAGMEEVNPFEWLSNIPANYGGEFYDSKTMVLKEGNWYFERGKKMLVYISSRKKTEDGLPKISRYQVKVLRDNSSVDTNGAPFVTIDGIVLRQIVE